MNDSTLHFYFDYISHNAYLAWTQIGALAARHGLELLPVPVVFGGLLSAHGQLGPAEIPAKSRWMLRDVLRKAAALDVPIRPPASHPFNPLCALRVTLLPMSDAERTRLIDALFVATWARGLDVAEAATVAGVLDDLGLPGDRWVADAQADDIKAALRENTDNALERGVFGVPSMIVADELFFGLDDFGHLEQFLAGEARIDEAQFAPWLAVRPSIRRQR